jgi:hypothetical protein
LANLKPARRNSAIKPCELGRALPRSRMFRAAAAVAAAVLALSAGAAGAQEAIPTARVATPLDVSREPPPPPLPPPGSQHSNLAAVQPGPCGTGPVPKLAPVDANGDPQVDHSPHGEVSVGMDSRGGRYAEGSVCVPVGDRSFVAVDVSGSQFNGGGWRR